MARFFGVRGKSVVWVASEDHTFDNCLPVPQELQHLSGGELIKYYVFERGALVRKGEAPKLADLRVAFVGVFGIDCGISTYSEALWKEMGVRVKDWRVFCEDGGALNGERVVPCWNRGKPLTRLIEKLKEYAPDVIFIQHEYGIFPSAAHWLSFLSATQGTRVIVTLHSVYDHLDKVVCEAACPEIVVHTELAREALQRKHISAPVHVIPHGCDTAQYERLWNVYRTRHTILQFGFGFRYKGWETSLRVVAELRKELSDIYFTGLLSRSPFDGPEADSYFEELRKLVEELKLGEHVALLRGYRSEGVLNCFFRTNSVGLFPYRDNKEHTVYGCSGAARRAMSMGLPIVTSPVPLFHDLVDIVPQEREVSELARAVKILFNPAARDAQRIRQSAFLFENSWSNVAGQYLALL